MMMSSRSRSSCGASIAIFAIALFTTSCASSPPPCNGPQSKNLDAAIVYVQSSLTAGCTAQFDRYYDDLLNIAEGDPKPENKRIFSEFLVWASDEGLLSQRQARDNYNRYFNVKFISMQSEYNNCSHTCPRRSAVMLDMERELSDKERGLLKVSQDSAGYYRADLLYNEVDLVLEATCTACAAGQ